VQVVAELNTAGPLTLSAGPATGASVEMTAPLPPI
jgi:hypothetical protein